MKVYVTGGVGFIGSALVHTLLSEGHEVAFIDDLSTGTVGNLDPRATFRTLDILDDGMSAHMAAFSPEVVVHLAAQSSVSASIKDPGRSMQVNAEGTARIAQAAVKAGARRVISASSAAVYGTPMGLPLAENAPCAPESPYGKSKLEGRNGLAPSWTAQASITQAFGLPTCMGQGRSSVATGALWRSFWRSSLPGCRR